MSSEEEDEDGVDDDNDDCTIKETSTKINYEDEKRIFNESENSEDDDVTRNMTRTKSASSILSMESALTVRTSAMTNYALLSSQSLRELNQVHSVTPLSKTFSPNKSNPNFSSRPLSTRNSASSLERIRSPQKKVC